MSKQIIQTNDAPKAIGPIHKRYVLVLVIPFIFQDKLDWMLSRCKWLMVSTHRSSKFFLT